MADDEQVWRMGGGLGEMRIDVLETEAGLADWKPCPAGGRPGTYIVTRRFFKLVLPNVPMAHAPGIASA